MPKAAREIPPPLELLCLRALWSLEEANVKEVRRVVTETRPLAYTTIMTVLERLVRKGKLKRRKVGRAFAYSPTESRDDMRRIAVRELLDGFFDGSEDELMAFLRTRERAVAASAGVAASARADERIDTVLL
jgi:predicted transcriptional regulator